MLCPTAKWIVNVYFTHDALSQSIFLIIASIFLKNLQSHIFFVTLSFMSRLHRYIFAGILCASLSGCSIFSHSSAFVAGAGTASYFFLTAKK